MIKISPSRGRRVKRILLNKTQPRTLKITISIMNTVHNTQMKTKPGLSPASWRDRGWIHNFYPQFWCKLLRNVPCSFRMSLLSWYHFRTQSILHGDQGWKGILITWGDRGERSSRAFATWFTKQNKLLMISRVRSPFPGVPGLCLCLSIFPHLAWGVVNSSVNRKDFPHWSLRTHGKQMDGEVL